MLQHPPKQWVGKYGSYFFLILVKRFRKWPCSQMWISLWKGVLLRYVGLN